MRPKMFIFGFGYTAHFLAEKLSILGIDVTGTSRKQTTYNNNYNLINFDRINIEKNLQSANYILISTPPSIYIGDPVLILFTDLIQKYAPQSAWIGYLSSTGVYGDHKGQWVDESSPSFSLGQQAQCRLAAENSWIFLANESQLPLHIFRLAGIYGPKRNALMRIKQGKSRSIYKENHCFSRIHVEDIVTVLLASINNPNPNSIYNVADDKPAPAYEVDEFAARLLNLPLPERVPFENAQLSSMEKEFYTHHRRVSNTKIKKDLLVKLNYPSYQEGLQHMYNYGDFL